MLKGQLDIDIEFMGGTIIFVFFTILFFTLLLAPIFTKSAMISRVETRVEHVTFSNLVKNYLYVDYGIYGATDFFAVSADENNENNTLGTFNNFILLEQIPHGRIITSGRPTNARTYDSYSLSSPASIYDTYGLSWTLITPVTERKEIVISAGKTYLVHVYRYGTDTVVDVYMYPKCSMTMGLAGSSFRYPLCSSVLNAEITDPLGFYTKSFLPVSNGAIDDSVIFVTSGSDVQASELYGSLRLDERGNCEEGVSMLCLRKFADYESPLRIHVEMGSEGFFDESGN